MKILIMGSGGTGAYYGALLARAGNEVTFIARGAHLEAMREKGLQVKSVHSDFTLEKVNATDNPAEAGIVDLVLFCVKAYDTETAARAILPALGEGTVVVSVQNGVDAAERMAAILGAGHVVGGATWISSAIEAPGVVRQASQFRRIVLGELNGAVSPRVESIVEVLKKAEIVAEATGAIQKTLWTKFTFIASVSSVGPLTRLTMGDYRSVPETRELLFSVMREVKALALEQGIMVDDDVEKKSMEFIDAAAPHIKPSMQLDVEAGKKFELEAMIGVICRKGRELGVPTPTADMVYAALLPIELKARSTT